MSPTSVSPNAPAANEVVAVDAVLNGDDIKDAKQASLVVDGLKKLSVPPKRVFVLAATPSLADWLKKPLGDAKISAVPVPGPNVKDWDKVLKTFGADKIYNNGPKTGIPNADLLTADQTKLSSTTVYDGVRFFLVNTETPVKDAKAGSIPRMWLLGKQADMKENTAVMIGYRAAKPLGKEDPTPTISTESYLAKGSKIKLFVSASAKTPILSRPDEGSNYQLAIGGAVGDDHLPHIGLIEVRKNGAIYSKILKLDVTKPPTAKLEATIFEPVVAAKVDPKKDLAGTSKDAAKDPSKDLTKEPTKDDTKDSGKGGGGSK